ncbi:MAG: hypothetical protein JKY37_31525 [Nannocystaceae bacterium]|nr:hypothetical protein [Nannocystaceae bacterium]
MAGTATVVGVSAAALVGMIATLQGAAWLGPRRARPRPVVGAALLVAGLLVSGVALLALLVPGFWGTL